MYATVKYYNLNSLQYFKIKCIPMVAKLNFQHHYSSLQRKMILQKSFKYADLFLKKHFF